MNEITESVIFTIKSPLFERYFLGKPIKQPALWLGMNNAELSMHTDFMQCSSLIGSIKIKDEELLFKGSLVKDISFSRMRNKISYKTFNEEYEIGIPFKNVVSLKSVGQSTLLVKYSKNLLSYQSFIVFVKNPLEKVKTMKRPSEFNDFLSSFKNQQINRKPQEPDLKICPACGRKLKADVKRGIVKCKCQWMYPIGLFEQTKNKIFTNFEFDFSFLYVVRHLLNTQFSPITPQLIEELKNRGTGRSIGSKIAGFFLGGVVGAAIGAAIEGSGPPNPVDLAHHLSIVFTLTYFEPLMRLIYKWKYLLVTKLDKLNLLNDRILNHIERYIYAFLIKYKGDPSMSWGFDNFLGIIQWPGVFNDMYPRTESSPEDFPSVYTKVLKDLFGEEKTLTTPIVQASKTKIASVVASEIEMDEISVCPYCNSELLNYAKNLLLKGESTMCPNCTQIISPKPNITTKSIFEEKIPEKTEIKEDIIPEKKKEETKICPFCGAENEKSATSCKECNVWFPE